VVKLFEVKAFEPMEEKKAEFGATYGKEEKYKCPELASSFIRFIEKIGTIEGREKKTPEITAYYGEGLKQLCCHLLGIVNELDGKLDGKNIELYSLCFDGYVSDECTELLENYKGALAKFKTLANDFLCEIRLSDRVTYCGYLPASVYIEENRKLLQEANCHYVKQRYFHGPRNEAMI